MAGSVTFQEITSEESWDIFNDAAQRLLNMTGEDLIAAWDAGELADVKRVELMQVLMLRPSGR
jgi:hypothetical protein